MKALMDCAREEDDVYFWRLDRIGRSVIDVLNTVNDFTSHGVRLHSIMDNLDPTSVQVLPAPVGPVRSEIPRRPVREAGAQGGNGGDPRCGCAGR